MRRYIIIFILVSAAYFALACGCSRKPASDNTVLAKVSNRFITLGNFNARFAKLPSYYQGVVEKSKKRYLDDMIVEMIFYEEAIRKGVDKDKELQEVINEAKKKIIVAKMIKNEVDDKAGVSEAEMRKFYEDNKNEFKTPPMWRASHILVATDKEAADILNELSQGGNFEELARMHSIDATASRGGDIGFFRIGQLVPDFENACMKLEVGQTSAVIHTKFGYHIIKLTDKREPSVEEFDKVKRAIEGELKRRKRSDLFDKLISDLKKKYGVEIKENASKILEESSATQAKGS